MSVYTNPPEWEAQGKKPPSSKRTEGWKPGDRVPASWLNWFWFSTMNSLREIAQAFVSHRDSTSGIHGATSSATANRLIIRDSNGRASVADPTSTSHIATKGYVDSAVASATDPTSPIATKDYVDSAVNNHANATSVHGATSSATANRIIIRDSAGRAKVAAPSASDDIATKGYVDSRIPASPTLPAGVIVMWSGSVSSIPSGWALCDGRNGTPDLRDRFIVGAGGSYNVGSRGGANTVTLNINQIPSHSHGAGTLKTDMTGSHSHEYWGFQTRRTAGGVASDEFLWGTTDRNTFSAGDHTHTISGNTASTGSGQAHENRPPYYALAYIMKL